MHSISASAAIGDPSSPVELLIPVSLETPMVRLSTSCSSADQTNCSVSTQVSSESPPSRHDILLAHSLHAQTFPLLSQMGARHTAKMSDVQIDQAAGCLLLRRLPKDDVSSVLSTVAPPPLTFLTLPPQDTLRGDYEEPHLLHLVTVACTGHLIFLLVI